MREWRQDSLRVVAAPDRRAMGRAAAQDLCAAMRALLAEKHEISMIFAAAPSQNEVLAELAASDVPWQRVHAYHMDEYIGLPAGAPQSFGRFLTEHLFGKVKLASVNLIDARATDAQAECARYAALLAARPADIIVMGIGENGHIAFNDPGEADFHDKKLVKVVNLDEVCRMQQVNDGCFQAIEEVPQYALTLTIPTLIRAPHLFCVVPCATKAQAVKNTVEGEISECCPASILRTQKGAILYCDKDSAALLNA